MALLAARVIQAQLYAVHPHDPVTYAVSVALILGGAAVACFIPALRAIATSPMEALGSE